jgi:RNA polymerase sigma factor (sigma-70 family)
LDNVLAYCRKLVGTRPAGAATDGSLLERFARQGDEAAFAELLHRHGPLVFGVCRRVLPDGHDAEDAFQATFLVLVRKAGSLDGRASVANWLYTVAFRIALKARAGAARRRAQEKQGGPMQATQRTDDGDWRDLQPVLDEELNRLPSKYRDPVVLCYLEGKTNEEAAELLGWTKGTVSGRLARARDLLRGRLSRRGITLSSGAFVTLLAEQATKTTVPVELGKATFKAAVALGAGSAVASVVSAPVARLVQEMVKQMSLTKLKIAVAVVAFCVVGASAALLTYTLSPSILDGTFFTRHETAPLPTLVVEVVYPGADARVVADSVAAPIEEQVNGVEKMRYMSSECTNDGRYVLTIAFAPDVDLDLAQVLVQNRVSLAMPLLPDPVQRGRVYVKKNAGSVLVFVVVSSDRHDSLYLSNYVNTDIKDSLASVDCVGNVACLGQYRSRVNINLDVEKLTARDLAAIDVLNALERETALAVAGQKPEKSTDPKSTTLLADVERYNGIVLKEDADGRMICLKDVANVEPGTDRVSGRVQFNGRSVVALAISPKRPGREQDVGAAVRDKVKQLQAGLPEGVHVEVGFDLSQNGANAPEYLRLDVVLPDASSSERTSAVLDKCVEIVRQTEGVQDVMDLCGLPYRPAENLGCVLVRLGPAGKGRASRQQIMKTLGTRFHEEIPVALVRLCDVSKATNSVLDGGYPIDLGVHGPENFQVERFANELAMALQKCPELTDVAEGLESRTTVPQLVASVDPAKAKAHGVQVADIYKTLPIFFGEQINGALNHDDKPWHVTVKVKQNFGFRWQVDDLSKVQVPNADRQMVPLSSLVEVHDTAGPAVVGRCNAQPMVEITANLALSVTPAEARVICEKLAEQVRKDLGLSTEYSVTWLREAAAAK